VTFSTVSQCHATVVPGHLQEILCTDHHNIKEVPIMSPLDNEVVTPVTVKLHRKVEKQRTLVATGLVVPSLLLKVRRISNVPY